MRKRNLIAVGILLFTTSLHAQSNEKWNVGIFTDLTKSKNQGFLEHFQIASELNYQIIKPVSITGGLEYWGPATGLGLVAGVRYYPHKNIFFRVRRLFFIDSAAIGAGWKKSIGQQWNFEAMADYYCEETLALRVGLSRTF